MKLVTLDTNQTVIGTGRSDSTVEAPDNVECDWQLNGQTWEKGAALLATEAVVADLASKRDNASQAVATLRTWADEGASDVAAWDTASTADKLIITKRLLNRTSIFWRRFADFYEGHQFKP